MREAAVIHHHHARGGVPEKGSVALTVMASLAHESATASGLTVHVHNAVTGDVAVELRHAKGIYKAVACKNEPGPNSPGVTVEKMLLAFDVSDFDKWLAAQP